MLQKVSSQLLGMCGAKKIDVETLLSAIDEVLSNEVVS